MRDQARLAIRGRGFDAIITDPPYGIRESLSSSLINNVEEDNNNNDAMDDTTLLPQLTQLFYAMGRDRSKGTPLLKPGGRLVAFVPVRKGETLEECLPDLKAMDSAGLIMEGPGKEQVLNDVLSRWLISFLCAPKE